MGIIGATFGFVLVYIIPLAINIIYYRRKHPPIELINQIDKGTDKEQSYKLANLNSTVSSNENENSDVTKEELITKFTKEYTLNPDLDLKDQFIYTGKKRNLCKDYAFYVMQVVLLLIGMFTMIFQFWQVNVFNIKIN